MFARDMRVTSHRLGCCVLMMHAITVDVTCKSFGNDNRYRKPAHETLFNSIVGGMFAEGIVPPGDILDAGANRGDTTLFLATVAPQRIVHAVDPWHYNIDMIRRFCAQNKLNNVDAEKAALSRDDGRVVDGSRLKTWGGGQLHNNDVQRLRQVSPSAEDNSTTIRMRSIDSIFAGKPAGFLHLDLEGGEHGALLGAKTVLAGAPVLSVEGFAYSKGAALQVVLRTLREWNYVCFQVDEVCGGRDCRNYLCFPAQRAVSFKGSHILDVAVGTGALSRVHSTEDARSIGARSGSGHVTMPRVELPNGEGERTRTFATEMAKGISYLKREPSHSNTTSIQEDEQPDELEQPAVASSL